MWKFQIKEKYNIDNIEGFESFVHDVVYSKVNQKIYKKRILINSLWTLVYFLWLATHWTISILFISEIKFWMYVTTIVLTCITIFIETGFYCWRRFIKLKPEFWFNAPCTCFTYSPSDIYNICLNYLGKWNQKMKDLYSTIITSKIEFDLVGNSKIWWYMHNPVINNMQIKYAREEFKMDDDDILNVFIMITEVKSYFLDKKEHYEIVDNIEYNNKKCKPIKFNIFKLISLGLHVLSVIYLVFAVFVIIVYTNQVLNQE